MKTRATLSDHIFAAKRAVAWTTGATAALVVAPVIAYRQALLYRTSQEARDAWQVLLDAAQVAVQHLMIHHAKYATPRRSSRSRQ